VRQDMGTTLWDATPAERAAANRESTAKEELGLDQ